MRRLGALFLFLSIFVAGLSPLPAEALTVSELQSKIVLLQAELARLIAQVPPPTLTRNLSEGMEGEDVRQLQVFLTAKGFFTFATATGYFGPVTAAAVAAFQRTNGLPPVGEVGPLTQALLARSLSSDLPSTSPSQTVVTRSSGAKHNNNRPDPVEDIAPTPDPVPAWVEDLRAPSGDLPLVASDFKNGRYWLEDAEVTIDDIWIEDTNWDSFDSVLSITPGSGLSYENTSDAGPVLSAAAVAMVGGEGTVLLQASTSLATTAGAEIYAMFAELPDDNSERGAYLVSSNTANKHPVIYGYDDDDSPELVMPAYSGGVTTLAFTSSDSELSYSIMGTTASTTAIASAFDPAINGFYVYPSEDAGDYVELIAIYPVQALADLDELSAPEANPAIAQALAFPTIPNLTLALGDSYEFLPRGGLGSMTVTSIGTPFPTDVILFGNANESLSIQFAATPGASTGHQLRVTDYSGATATSNTFDLTVTP